MASSTKPLHIEMIHLEPEFKSGSIPASLKNSVLFSGKTWMRLTHGLCLLCCSFLLSATAAAENTHYSGKIVRDQSQDVFFEQLASNTFSLQLLQNKDKFDNKTLVLGGVGQLDQQHWQGNEITTVPIEKYHIGSSFYFTAATFDMMGKYNNWTTAFLSISDTHIGQGGPNRNYVYFPHAFLLFGDLKTSPVYLAVGINAITFGNFTGSGVWNSPLTLNYFSLQQSPQISLGFYKNQWDISATLFSDEVNHENHFIANLNYTNTLHDFSYGFGLGHINDLKTNSTGSPSSSARRRKFSPILDMGKIWDVNATVGYKQLSLIGEYLAGSKWILTNTDIPKAFSLTLSYAPTIAGKATTFGINHSVSLNLNNVPTTLPGKDASPLVSSGLKSSSAISVSRPVFTQNFTLGLDAEKAITYDNRQTFTYTLDLLAYL
jgi:hypothetical protein